MATKCIHKTKHVKVNRAGINPKLPRTHYLHKLADLTEEDERAAAKAKKATNKPANENLTVVGLAHELLDRGLTVIDERYKGDLKGIENVKLVAQAYQYAGVLFQVRAAALLSDEGIEDYDIGQILSDISDND